MLILTRRMGERVMVGDNITVTVLAVQGSQIKLGIAAPNDVAVHREEVYERIKLERQSDGTQSAGLPEELQIATSRHR